MQKSTHAARTPSTAKRQAHPDRRRGEAGDASDPSKPIPPDPGKSTDIEIDERGDGADAKKMGRLMRQP